MNDNHFSRTPNSDTSGYRGPRLPGQRKTYTTLLLVFNLLLAVTLACSLPGFVSGGQKGTPTSTSSVPATPAPPTPTPRPLPPALVESDPPPGAEIPLIGPITLFFNQPMQRSSVEASLSGASALVGNLTWVNDSTLKLDPSQPLVPENPVALSISTDARSASGLALTQPISLTYHTAGFLRLTQSLPEPASADIDPTSAVVAAFNRPVVPLGADSSGLPAGFSIEPTANGKGEWLNTSTYIFYPQPGLEGGKSYTVKLNPGLTSTDGSPLEEVKEWTFTTAKPRLVKVEPDKTGASLRLDAEIVLTFNQPMDPASVEANFRLLDPASTPVPGKASWSEDGTTLTFKPDSMLSRGTLYRATLNAQAQGRGGTPIGEMTEVDLQTVPNLAITGSDPQPGRQKLPYAGVTLYFNGPIVNKNIDQYITVSPAITNQSTYWDETINTLNIYGDFSASTNYTVSLSPSLPDPWGGTLGQAYTLSFSSAPLDPQVIITTGTDILLLTPRDASLTAQVTNLSSLPLRRGTVPLKDFTKMMGPNGYEFRSSYKSNDEVSWTQSIDVPANRSTPVDVFVSPDQSSLGPGLYYLRMSPPIQNVNPTPYLIAVSNVQLTYKLSATDALVWAVDLRSNTPIANAPVQLYDETGSPLASGLTDQDGIFRASITPRQDPYSASYAVIGQPGGDTFGLALSTWSQGTQPWDFGIMASYTPPHQEAYLYTDRPIYRPGQTVYFRAVVRQAYNGRYSLPDKSSVQLKVFGPLGGELDTIDLPLSAFGTGHSQYVLTQDAQPGYYSISLADDRYGSTITFQVAEYRKPEINLQVSFPSDQVQSGETVTATVNARYFFDAPAGNIPVKWALYAARSTFELPGYQVGAEDTSWLSAFYIPNFGDNLGPQVASGEAKTDPQGLLTLEVPTVFDEKQTGFKKDRRQQLTLEVTLTDESGLPVSARAKLQINPAEYYIGVRPDAWVGQSGTEAGFNILAADWNQQPAGVHSLRAEFKKVVWVRDEPKEIYLGPTYTPQYTPVGSTDFQTNDQGQARVAFTPPEPGTYELDVTGDGALTQFILWVGGPGQAVWPNLPNQRLRLTADRDSYKPGDTAQVFVPNPFSARSQALLTIERGVVLRYELINLEPGGSMISLPLSDDDAPNVFVSITLLGQGQDGRPDYRQGYTELKVEPVQQTLNVALTSQPQKAGPGDEVSFDVQVTDSSGKPVEGEFSLAVVDLAALALADPNSQEIVPAFYGEQPLGVQTGLALAVYANRQSTLPAGGGGGGGGEVAPVVRENFPDTAYWNAELVTDAQGRAHVSLALPDTLTTWNVDVRGLTSDTRVGQAQSQVVTSKELLVRPATPRFLVVDDHVKLSAVVQNNTQNPLQAQVSLQADGFTLDDAGSASQAVSLPANGRARVEWWGKTQDVEKVDLIFSASSGNLSDVTRPAAGSLPVLRYTASQTFATSGIMDEADQRLELVSLPRSFDPRGGSLDVEMAPSLATAMLNALDALENYPYDCTEQTISRFLPNLETYRVLQQFGIDSPDLKTRLERTLSEGLQRMLARQNSDGGWGWWQGSTSDPYISAYVLFGLVRAQQAGSSVPQNALQQAADYLRTTLVAPASVKDDWQLDRLAFSHFVLSEAAKAGFGAADPSSADALYERRDELDSWAQAMLALTYENLSTGSEKAKTLTSDLESTAVRSATGAHWENKHLGLQNMSSTLTTTAMVAYTLAQRDPGTPLLSEVVRYLMSNRLPGGAWNSTYATAWSLMALDEVMRGTAELGGDFTFSATLNGAPLASGQAGGAGEGVAPPVTASAPLSSLYPQDPNALVIERQPGTGRLYYTADLKVSRPVETVAPLSQGISVARAYYPVGPACTAANCPALQSAPAGEQVKVRVTITLPHDAYYLLVEDYIPAGAEILDTSLKTSQQGQPPSPDGEQPPPAPLYDPRNPFESGFGWWLFKDPQIFDDHITWAADYIPAGTYELTYTLTALHAGQYRVLPAHALEFYFPEVQGNSAGVTFEVK